MTNPLYLARRTDGGWLKESVSGNARLLAAAYTSYDKHCVANAVECAEGDLLGQALEALQNAVLIMQEAGYAEQHDRNLALEAIQRGGAVLAKATLGERLCTS